MERLTIKELAAYLPYKLEVKTSEYNEIFEVCSYNPSTDEWLVYDNIDGSVVEYCREILKPLLRPLSSIDLKWFQDNIDEAIEDFRINCEPENNHFSVEVCEKVLGWSALSLEEYQLFYRDHVDIHGLIDRNLALPIDGKEVEGE